MRKRAPGGKARSESKPPRTKARNTKKSIAKQLREHGTK